MACLTTDPRSEEDRQIREAASREIEMGKAAVTYITGKYGIVRNETATSYLNKFLQSLALYTQRQEILYRCGILATERINAYALPGGYIFITLGTLKRIENPGTLAGILAHELGHLNLRHPMNKVTVEVNPGQVQTLQELLSGSRRVITDNMDLICQKIEKRLFVDGYLPEDEYDADKYAVELLEVLNINASDYMHYFERLDKAGETRLAELYRTHPPLKDRAEYLEMLAGLNPEVLYKTEQFREFKIIIDGINLE